MINHFADFMNTQLELGVKGRAGCDPFQWLFVTRKTVETVCRPLGWLHPAEARC